MKEDGEVVLWLYRVCDQLTLQTDLVQLPSPVPLSLHALLTSASQLPSPVPLSLHVLVTSASQRLVRHGLGVRGASVDRNIYRRIPALAETMDVVSAGSSGVTGGSSGLRTGTCAGRGSGFVEEVGSIEDWITRLQPSNPRRVVILQE